MNYSEILVRIRRIVRSINLESKRVQKLYGVSIPQVLCLSFLKDSDNYQATHKQITKFLDLNSSTATGIIDRLEKKGYVARLPRKDDKRSTHIALTIKGDELLDKVPPLLHERLSRSLESLSDSRLKEIITALDAVIGFLGVDDVEASPVITIEDDIGLSG